MKNASVEKYKRIAALAAVEHIRSNTIIGLGSGSTAKLILEPIAEKIKAGALHGLIGISSSRETQEAAERLNIPLGDLNEHPHIDVNIDGADEVDPVLNLIKGGGGALLREKIIAQASRRNLIIVDASKLSPTLGTRFALPIEVFPFGWRGQMEFVSSLGSRVILRYQDDQPFLTDQGNYILDATFGPIADAHALAGALEGRPGIIEHGLFLGLATDLFVAGPKGVEHQGQPVGKA